MQLYAYETVIVFLKIFLSGTIHKKFRHVRKSKVMWKETLTVVYGLTHLVTPLKGFITVSNEF